MASIGDLVANLTVNTSGWSRGFNSAIGESKKFASGIGGMLSAPTAAFKQIGAVALYAGNSILSMIDSLKELLAIGASLAAGGSIIAITTSIQTLAEVADTAARTGLSGKFLQKLGYAADQAGVDSDTLTKSLSKMTLVIGEATTGSRTAQAAFRRLGITVSDLRGMSPESQFAAIAGALSAIPGTAQRAAAAVDIFGKSGAELGPLLQQGAAGLVAAMDQAAALGIGLSDEDIAKASEADDAMQRMSATISAVVEKVSASLAPVWTAFANTVTATIPVIGTFFDSIVSSLGWTVETAVSVFDEVSSLGVTALSIVEFAFNNVSDIGQLAFLSIRLKLIQLTGEISHFFKQGLPSYLSWFADNWQDVFYTAFDFVATGFINLGENIRNAWSAILAYITGDSESLGLVWKPLTEGFVSTVKELPDIPERAISDLEQQLTKDTSNLGQNLGNSLTGTIEKNLAMLPKVKAALAIETPKTAPVTDEALGKSTGSAADANKLSGAMEQGSADAYSAIVQAMTRGGDNKIQVDQLNVLRQINGNLRRSNTAANQPAVVGSFT